jgi:hypothetical protein
MAPAQNDSIVSCGSESQQVIPGLLDSLGHRALLLGRQTGILTGQNLPGVRNVAVHQLRVGEWEVFRGQTLLLFFGSAHDLDGREEDCASSKVVNLRISAGLEG